jgi:hypothetical protein
MNIRSGTLFYINDVIRINQRSRRNGFFLNLTALLSGLQMTLKVV